MANLFNFLNDCNYVDSFVPELVTAPRKIKPSQILMIPMYIFFLQYLKFNLQV